MRKPVLKIDRRVDRSCLHSGEMIPRCNAAVAASVRSLTFNFSSDMTDVELHRNFRDVQNRCNFLIAESLRHHAQDLDFPAGQRPMCHPRSQNSRHRGIEVLLSGGDFAYGSQQLFPDRFKLEIQGTSTLQEASLLSAAYHLRLPDELCCFQEILHQLPSGLPKKTRKGRE
jgi:hypothetical protein